MAKRCAFCEIDGNSSNLLVKLKTNSTKTQHACTQCNDPNYRSRMCGTDRFQYHSGTIYVCESCTSSSNARQAAAKSSMCCGLFYPGSDKEAHSLANNRTKVISSWMSTNEVAQFASSLPFSVGHTIDYRNQKLQVEGAKKNVKGEKGGLEQIATKKWVLNPELVEEPSTRTLLEELQRGRNKDMGMRIKLTCKGNGPDCRMRCGQRIAGVQHLGPDDLCPTCSTRLGTGTDTKDHRTCRWQLELLYLTQDLDRVFLRERVSNCMWHPLAQYAHKLQLAEVADTAAADVEPGGVRRSKRLAGIEAGADTAAGAQGAAGKGRGFWVASSQAEMDSYAPVVYIRNIRKGNGHDLTSEDWHLKIGAAQGSMRLPAGWDRGQSQTIIRTFTNGSFGNTRQVKILGYKELVITKAAYKPRAVKQLKHEAHMLQLIHRHGQCPYVVQLLATKEDQAGKSFTVAMESMPMDLVTYSAGYMDETSSREKQVAHIAWKLGEVLVDLHTRNIVHGDLKCGNAGIDPITHQIKLLDFGSSCITTARHGCVINVTPYIRSPAIAAQKPIKIITPADDMWALGVLVYELMAGDFPWTNNPDVPSGEYRYTKEQWMLEQIRDPTKHVRMDVGSLAVAADCKDFIKKCMCRNVSRRLTAKQAMKHRWIRNNQF